MERPISRERLGGRALREGLAGGAATEVKAKIRTLRCELERGLSRTVLDDHAGVADSRGSNIHSIHTALASTDEHRSARSGVVHALRAT